MKIISIVSSSRHLINKIDFARNSEKFFDSFEHISQIQNHSLTKVEFDWLIGKTRHWIYHRWIHPFDLDDPDDTDEHILSSSLFDRNHGRKSLLEDRSMVDHDLPEMGLIVHLQNEWEWWITCRFKTQYVWMLCRTSGRMCVWFWMAFKLI